jgi:gliding motility-associated-like protein
MIQRLLFLLLLSICCLCSRAQILIDNTTYNPTQLVTNILLGNGVTASNISFTPAAGANIQLGYFNGVNSNLGLDSGIVLATGDVMEIEPGFVGGLMPPGGSDPDLLTVANSVPPLIGQAFVVGATEDAAILEFDFVPASDTVRFKYIFASDEYQTFINTSFNDVFAFFISGPGITGPFASPPGFPGGAANIAVVPNSNPPLPITISSVQPALNGQYYIDNPAQSTVGMMGFTTVLTATAGVTCGLTYHIKLAIADGTDPLLTSAVFLEANSFSSQGVAISSDIDIGDSDSILYEGCGTAQIAMQRGGNIASYDTIRFSIGGSPNNNDYNSFADSIIFFPGQTNAFISIQAYQDNLAEPLDTITITTISGPCSGVASTITIYISDAPAMTAQAGADTTLRCKGDPAQLYAYGSDGLPGYTYVWNQGLGTGRLKTVNPLVTTDYIVSVFDTCMQMFDTDTMRVNVPSYPPLQAVASADQFITCPNQIVTVFANGLGGLPPYSFFWLNPVSTGPTLQDTANGNSEYVVMVKDACGIDQDLDTVKIFQIPFDSLFIFLPQDITICPGDSIYLDSRQSGGVANYYYNWPHSGENSKGVWVKPSKSDAYTIEVRDSCGNRSTGSTWINVREPLADFTYANFPEGNFQIFFNDQSEHGIEFNWDFGDGESGSGPDIIHQYPDSGTYLVRLIMKDEDQCLDTVLKEVNVLPELSLFIPSAFTPNGDGKNDILIGSSHGVDEAELMIFDRWGGMIFKTNDPKSLAWDGKTSDGKAAPQGAYVYLISARNLAGKSIKKKGSITLIR